MKIIYIPSGFKGIYEVFDEAIVKELTLLGHDVQTISPLAPTEQVHRLIRSFPPDLILTMIGTRLSKRLLIFFKQKGLTTAVWLTEDPFYIDQTITFINYYHYIFTIDTAALEIYHRHKHKASYYLPLGADEGIFKPAPSVQKAFDLVLVGYPYPERIKLINMLQEKSNWRLLVAGSKWNQLLAPSKKKNNCTVISRWLHPKQVASYYQKAKIVINTHRPFDLKENKNSLAIVNKSLNNRSFEIACCGTFQLVDSKAELAPHFQEEKELITFSNYEDFFDKASYYLANPQQREIIAKRAQKKALQAHTLNCRLKEMLKKISI